MRIAAANVLKEFVCANFRLPAVTPAPAAALLMLMCIT